MIQGRISVTKKRNFQSPRKKFIQKRIETPKLNRPVFTVNKSTRRYTELRRKNNHTTNNLKFLLKTNFKFFNFSMNLLNILFISGITTISSTEITCNHGFEYRTENLPSRIIRKFYPGFNTGYRHFQTPNTLGAVRKSNCDRFPIAKYKVLKGEGGGCQNLSQIQKIG